MRHPIYEAVCVGLIIRFKPRVISINEEPVKVKDVNGALIIVPVGCCLFDTGNDAATAVSQELVDELGLLPDRRKLTKVVGIGGAVCQCSKVSLDLVVRGHRFSVEALVGAVAPDTDLLIGSDIIKQLIELKFTLGE
ncbi:hypothetical protein OS493_006211 [Desmophyllum pertusum]|uniref:Uncharacterized protein n=1 Tax=Desmophyllum pertusum TaxID=174260 RepID=A0A9X0A4H0_9CNID|nr:hypothetical protein OS493_006211 [Desmophyllum pertusum]